MKTARDGMASTPEDTSLQRGTGSCPDVAQWVQVHTAYFPPALAEVQTCRALLGPISHFGGEAWPATSLFTHEETEA